MRGGGTVPKVLRIKTTVLLGSKAELTNEELEVARAEHKGKPRTATRLL